MPARLQLRPVDVLLHLGAAPLFADLPPPLLALVAAQVRARRFARRELVYSPGKPVHSLHVVAQGGLSVPLPAGGTHTFAPGAAVGALLVFQRELAAPEIRAVSSATVTLELDGETLVDLLEDQPRLLEHLLAALARRLIAERAHIPENAGYARLADTEGPPRELDLVERIVALRHALPLAHTSIDALAELARQVTEIRLGKGQKLWSAGDPADAIILPVSGGLACRTEPGLDFEVGGGVMIGLLDALAGSPRWYSATTTRELVALRVEAGTFADVLESEFNLALALLTTLTGEAVELLPRLGRAAEAAGWL